MLQLAFILDHGRQVQIIVQVTTVGTCPTEVFIAQLSEELMQMLLPRHNGCQELVDDLLQFTGD